MMRIVFMGTPEFAEPTLELLRQQHQVVGIYTQPPKPSGRGYQLTKSATQRWAENNHIPCFYPSTLKKNEIQEELKALRPDLIVVVAYGLILPLAVLNIPPYGCYNVHFSLLPRWRGAAPMQRALQVGDAVTGVTLMKMDEGLDTGAIISQQEFVIFPSCSYEQLSEQLALIGAQLMAKACEQLSLHSPLEEIPQPTEGVTYAHKIKKEEGFLNWAYSAVTLQNLIRALNPWPGTSFIYQNQRIKVLEAVVEEDSFQENDKKPGMIMDEHLGIYCGGYHPFTGCWEAPKILRPLSLQKPGGKVMTREEFLRGFPLPKGIILQ